MGIFDPDSKFDAIAAVLRQSRWFDGSWMSLVKSEGYPRLGAFGLRSGPAFAAYAFYHDLAHAMISVEDDQGWRLGRNSFGLDYTTQIEVLGEIYREPVTDQGVQLELRVIALQYRLTYLDTIDDPVLEIEPKKEFFKWHVRSLRYMADFLMAKCKYREQGLTGNTRRNSDEEESLVIELLIDQCQKLADGWSESWVRGIWQDTCKEAHCIKAQLEAEEEAA